VTTLAAGAGGHSGKQLRFDIQQQPLRAADSAIKTFISTPSVWQRNPCRCRQGACSGSQSYRTSSGQHQQFPFAGFWLMWTTDVSRRI